MNLSYKIGAVVFTGAFVILLMTGFLSYFLTRNALQASISRNQEEIVRQTTDKIDRLLYERYLDIQSIGDEQDIETFVSSGGKNVSTIKKQLTDLTFLTGPWDQLLIMDASQRVVLSSTNDAPTLNDEELSAYTQALSGKTYYSDYVAQGGVPAILFASPIIDKVDFEHPVRGVAMGTLSWPVVTAILRGINANSQFNLYNEKGSRIATNKDTGVPDFLPDSAVASLVHETIATGLATTLTVASSSGEAYLVSSALSQGYLAYKNRGWVLVTETPLDTALAPARSAAVRALLFLFPVIVGMIVLIFIALRIIVIRRLASVTEVTKNIAAGDLSQRANVESKDEIGVLARSFNTMTSKLQETYAGLDKKVQEKTAQLTEQLGEVQRMNKLMVDRELKMIELKKEITRLTSGQ